MAPIRILGRALVVAGALSIPALASAHDATSLCEGGKMEEKEPTAEKSSSKRDADKADKKADDKSAPKAGAKDANRS